MKSWLTQGSLGSRRIDTSTRYNFSPHNGPKNAETDSRGMGLCYIMQPGKLN